MRNLFVIPGLLIASLLLLCLGIKVVYFRYSGRKGFDQFVRTFFKQYSSYRMNDTSSQVKRSFMKVNNRINYLWWILWLLTLIAFVGYKMFS